MPKNSGKSRDSVLLMLAEADSGRTRWERLDEGTPLDNTFSTLLRLAELEVIPFEVRCDRMVMPKEATAMLIMKDDTANRERWIEALAHYGWVRCGGIVEPPTFIHEDYPPPRPRRIG